MMSIKETKKKFTTIVIISLFIATMFYFNPENTTVLTDLQEEKQVNEQINDSQQIDSVIEAPTRSIIDYNVWYSDGPSVKTDIEFNKQTVDFETLMVVSADAYNPVVRVQELQREGVYTDDSTDYYIIWELDTPDIVPTCYVYLDIYCGGSGDLVTKQHISIRDTSPINRNSADVSNTFTVNSNYLDAEGYLHLMWYLKASSTTETVWIFLYFINPLGTITSIYSHSEVVTAFVSVGIMRLVSNMLYFQRDTITNNVRSEYKYNSPTTMTFAVNPPGVAFAKEMNIYYNEDELTYSSITPTASVTDSSGVLTINSPTEIDYEILFLSSCSNHLALEDVSSTYLTDVGFETGEYQNDWYYETSLLFDSVTIATDIVFEGSYSLKLVDTDGSADSFAYHYDSGGSTIDIEAGEYYVSFAYYVSSFSGSSLRWYWRNNGAWSYEILDTSVTDRWITHKTYFHLDPETNGNDIMLYLYASQGVVYLDNFKIFQTSTTIKTTQSSESQIDFDGLVFDGYKFAQDSFRDYQVEIWDRTAQTLEYSYTVTTDEFGYGSITHPYALEQKEYEIRAYSLDSYFGSEQTQEDVTNSLSDWALAGEDIGTETASCVDSTIIFEFHETATANWEMRYNPSSTFDISMSDILYYTYRSNVTTELNYKWIRTDSSNHILNQTNQDFTADVIYHLVDSFIHSDWAETGSFDKTSIDMVYLREQSTTGWIKVEIFDFRFINTQKLYFTPSYSSEISDYATDELNDAWDFSEGDFELTKVTGSTANEVVENGYYYADCDVASWNTLLLQDSALSVPIDCSYYTHLLFRAKMDDWVDGGNRWEFTAYDGATPYDTEFYYTDWVSPTDAEYGEWITWLVDLRTTTNFRAGYQWGVDFTTLDKIQVYHTGSQAHEMTEDLWIDYIAFVHIDSWLEETNDYATDELLDTWDFEEGDTETLAWQTNTPASVTNVDGKLRIEVTSSISSTDTYLKFNTPPYPDGDNYDSLIIKVKSNVIGLIKMYTYSGGVVQYAQVSTYDDETFHVETCSLSNKDLMITQSIRFRLRIDTGFLEVGDYFELEYIRIISLEEMPYETIQNSVLLESETNDYQYNLYLDHNLIGTFSDLSLIPLIQSAGTHYLSVQPFKTDGPYSTQQIFSYYYEVDAEAFAVSLESFYLSDLYVNTYVTSNYAGTYIVYEDGGSIDSGTLHKEGTTIITSRDVTPGASINYTIAFSYASEMVAFKTYYNNPSSDFFVTSYSVDIDTTITVTWGTSKTSTDSLTIIEDGVEKVTDDPASTTTWTKSTVEGTHVVTLIFEATDYADILYSFVYTVAGIDSFSVSVENFYLSDTYVNTYATSNYDGNYYVYQDNILDGSGSLAAIGTTISSARDTTAGATIEYAIKFVYNAEIVWFNTTYSNAYEAFAIESYFVAMTSTTITISWDTTKDSTDSLSIYEDDVLKVNADPTSTSSWTKSTEVGEHYVTLIFSATNFLDIIYSFTYTVAATEDFQVNIESFYLSDDYVNLYVTSSYDYSYSAYTNGSLSGSGNGLSVGTFIIIPKLREAGIFNLTVEFVYGAESVLFMTWYSNLIPPPEPTNTIYREQSQGFYNITFETNLDFYWIDIYHDNVLVHDDSTDTLYAIEKSLEVGWHNVSVYYIYNCSTDNEGYPIPEYNITLSYTFWYETVLFFETQIRYVPMDLGLAIGEFQASWVKTYLDGELVQRALITDLDEYSNYSFISYEEIFIRNSMPIHELVVTDLFDRVIINTTIDISSFKYNVIELPIFRLSILNLDTENHYVTVRPYLSGEEWQTSPELAYGQSIEFWVCNRTYEFKVYSVVSTYYDSGVLIYVWDEDKAKPIPPKEVPITIIIPAEDDDETTSEGDSSSIWSNPIFWIIIIGGILVMIIVWYVRKKSAELRALVDKRITDSKERKKRGKVPEKEKFGL